MRRIAILIGLVALVAAACGTGDDGAATGASDEPMTEASEEMMTEGLHTAQTELGAALVGSNGLTLYVFVPDVPGASNCVDDCAVAWPPLAADAIGTPGDGIDVSLLGEITRPDGSPQATYNGRPLYFFAGDAAPGDVNGQGLNDVWFVIGPDGQGIGLPQAGSGSESLGY